MIHLSKNDELMSECQNYFKKRPVFDKLFLGFKKKYESFGRMGGTVALRNLSLDEKKQLGGFFQKDYCMNKTVSISMKNMEMALGNSKFSNFSWEDILEEYFGEALKGKKEEIEKEKEERQRFFEHMMNEYADEKGASWLMYIGSEHGKGYQLFLQQYKEDPVRLECVLSHVLASIPQLPVFSSRKERLAVFAANMTGNPHFYDAETLAERLLILFLNFYFSKDDNKETSGPEQKSMIFYQAGIMRDDISNHIMAYGIHGKDENGKIHSGIEGFFQRKEPIVLTLYTLGKLEEIWSTEDKVYVVENPAVFSWLCEQNPEKSVVCTNGQLRLAAFVLLDQLSKHSVLYYAGDYDPEGLLIAQKVKQRYGEQARLWQYHLEYYQKYLSEVVLAEERLKKLEKVNLSELQEIKKRMLEEKRAVYQENMLDEYR